MTFWLFWMGNFVFSVGNEQNLLGKRAEFLFLFLGLNMHFIPVIRGRLKFHPQAYLSSDFALANINHFTFGPN